MTDRMKENEIFAMLDKIPGWEYLGEVRVLFRSFEFKNFSEAFDFIKKVAAISEEKNHHPEWGNKYNKVFITLRTHSVGAITQKDIELAIAINAIL